MPIRFNVNRFIYMVLIVKFSTDKWSKKGKEGFI